MSVDGLAAAQEGMREAGVHSIAIDVFTYYYRLLETGETGIVSEADIEPLTDPVRLDDVNPGEEAGLEALAATAVVKLNGGLGTSMGLDRAKSLLEVREGLNFLDVIVRQVQRARMRSGVRLPLVFMSSFRTHDDTLAVLDQYAELAVDGVDRDFVQNREPKLRADDLTPVDWPADPDLAWCPPGHGDLYTAITTSGVLQQLLDAGFRYAFVSNGDNLGAVADPAIAGWFAASGAPFASEVCRRTSADRKGGHLAVRRRDGQLVLRDSAQTAESDAASFGDITLHRYFNANNLWLDLHHLAETMQRTGGVLGLPMIRNEKNVDPSDKASPKVIQIETAMGAAVEVFAGAQALEVDRSRFLPVKSTNDLLALRSDVYELADDCSVRLARTDADAPYVDLDGDFYKLIADFDARFPAGVPSLRQAKSFVVHGDWTFERDVVVSGQVEVDRDGSPGVIQAGTVLGPDPAR
ncbi:MAG: UTP--glucose-1-phosphate uridylyltransferase [Nocardioidaceae bacterium]|nr:UTP--glucose-1-phosphate uridylyltransferase [Nocardioidaceae bacterium]